MSNYHLALDSSYRYECTVKNAVSIADKHTEDIINFFSHEIYDFYDRDSHYRFSRSSERGPDDILFMMNNSISLRSRTFAVDSCSSGPFLIKIHLFEVIKNHFIALITPSSNLSKEHLHVLFLTCSGDRIIMSTYGHPISKFMSCAEEIFLFWDEAEAIENHYDSEEEIEIVMKDYFDYLAPIRSEAMSMLLTSLIRNGDSQNEMRKRVRYIDKAYTSDWV